MDSLIASLIPPPSAWNGLNGSAELWIKGIVSVLAVSAMFFMMRNAGPRQRKFIVGAATFVAGAFYVAWWLFPSPVNRKPGEMPLGVGESISFWFDDAVPVVAAISNILAAFLLGLGVFSVVTIHGARLLKRQKDWAFSAVLFVGIAAMTLYGYWDWYTRLHSANLDLEQNWSFVNKANDLLFYGLLQDMDAAMFSIVAFYILSAAYRAFRVRSVEATILLASAVIMMLSLLGGFEYFWNMQAQHFGGDTFSLMEISKWLRDSFQVPSIRAIDFGVGIGALAMGLRLWLSLEKQGAN